MVSIQIINMLIVNMQTMCILIISSLIVDILTISLPIISILTNSANDLEDLRSMLRKNMDPKHASEELRHVYARSMLLDRNDFACNNVPRE